MTNLLLLRASLLGYLCNITNGGLEVENGGGETCYGRKPLGDAKGARTGCVV